MVAVALESLTFHLAGGRFAALIVILTDVLLTQDSRSNFEISPQIKKFI